MKPAPRLARFFKVVKADWLWHNHTKMHVVVDGLPLLPPPPPDTRTDKHENDNSILGINFFLRNDFIIGVIV